MIKFTLTKHRTGTFLDVYKDNNRIATLRCNNNFEAIKKMNEAKKLLNERGI